MASPAVKVRTSRVGGGQKVRFHAGRMVENSWHVLRGSELCGSGMLNTDAGGKAEILLNPGIFLRLGNDSAVEMVSGLKNVEAQLNNGRAIVEVDQISPDSKVRIREHGITANLKATGLYHNSMLTAIVFAFSKAKQSSINARLCQPGGRLRRCW